MTNFVVIEKDSLNKSEVNAELIPNYITNTKC